MDHGTFARLCLDPVRSTALGHAAAGFADVSTESEAAGVPRRIALTAIGNLRPAGSTDVAGRLIDRISYGLAGSSSPHAAVDVT